MDDLVAITDWVLAQARGTGLERLLKHVASLSSSDPAWISIASPQLIQSQWDELEALRRRGELLPLFGVPFAVKDNIDVQGFQTTAACPDFAYLAAKDAAIITVLKLAGAIVVGKTNLDQFATGLVGTRSPYGVVPNTFDERYVSGGSSSGSASVVARGLVPFALGTDTAGSGRVPAGLNNIVGLKPTRGALSARGVVPACRSLDCVSILALTVDDAEMVFQLSAIYDENDAFSRIAPTLNGLQARAPVPQIAICENPRWFGDNQQKSAYEEALKSCKEASWHVVPTDFSPLFKLAGLLYEGPWVAERYAAIKDFINRPDVQMDPVVHGIISQARNFSSVDVFEGEYLRRELTRKIDTQFAKFDAILVPTTPNFPTIQDLVDNPILENSRLGTYTNFVNFMDWSALSFPSGFRSDGLPFGLTLISAQWQERKLLDLSRQVLSRTSKLLGHTGVLHQEEAARTDPRPLQTRMAVVGAHLTGLPLNHQLLDIGATFHTATLTAPRYRLYELIPAPAPKLIRKPGLHRVEADDKRGVSIDVEVWTLPITELARFARSIPPPLSLGPLELIDGSWVTGFVCEDIEPENVKADISEYGGWKKSLEADSSDSVEEQIRKPPLNVAFKKVLIANRGEIAVRIASTLKKLGIHSVSVHSKQDRDSRHVVVTDSTYLLEGSTVAETYLSGSQIIKIAKIAGADGIIPGYGFLSENADFAESCEKEGLVWIGPTPHQMRSLGLKHLAREVALSADVPLLPGSAVLQDVQHALKEGDRIEYPLMLKATAGGGGLGLVKCSNAEQLRLAFTTVAHQGSTYFSNGAAFLERFVEDIRHIEVQIIGDGRGKVRHVGVRDCTLQRRNQKIIEESPAVFVPEETCQEMCEAAIRIARCVSYRSVGTVEFIYDAKSGSFYFLEVNTRLQVEHTVTEAVSGLDLVEAMIRVASNDSSYLFSNNNINNTTIRSNEETVQHVRGHAIEARIYAETPLLDFRPSTGTISELRFPKDARIDTWISMGTEITSTFDPLLAKITIHGSDRKDAILRLQKALHATTISGVETNLAYLQAIAAWDTFAANNFTTASLDTFVHSQQVFKVLDAGSLTTVQDWPGRLGLWHVGVPPSGPMDDYSFRLANKIVDNAPGMAGLECTSQGPSLLFHWPATVAVTGAPAAITIDDTPVPMFQPLIVQPGEVLTIGAATSGFRTYLAIAGGITVPLVHGSASTFGLGQLGGHDGRALRADDLVRIARSVPDLPPRPSIDAPSPLPNKYILHVLAGPHSTPFFTPQAYTSLFAPAAKWKVHYNSNRIGIRLVGPKPTFARHDGGEAGLHPSNIHDSPYSVGSISFTGDEAVIGTCDGPSLGGFLIFATVITADLWKLGQVRSGDEIALVPVGVQAAMRMEAEQRASIERMVPFPGLESGDKQRRVVEWEILDPVIGVIDCHGVERRITCRQSGDTALLLEFGDDGFTMRTSFHIYAFIRAHNQLSATDPAYAAAIKELTPGVRAVHVRYAISIPQKAVVALLEKVELSLGPSLPVTAPSRVVSIPIVFEHASTLAAITRYARTIRPTAPYLPSNIDFLTTLNNLPSREALTSIFLSAEFLVLGLGDVFFGAPCAVPLDPRHRLFGTKYSPPRSFTPDGTVGIGGQYLCIYGTDSPGGYQIVGRTVPIWDRWAGSGGGDGEGGDIGNKKREKMWMFEVFDRIRFYALDEETLDAARETKTIHQLVKIEDGELNLEEYEDWMGQENVMGEAAELRRARLKRLGEGGLMEELKQTFQSTKGWADDHDGMGEMAEQGLLVKAEISGRCWQCVVEEGHVVEVGHELISVESMKMDVKILAPRGGRVAKLLVRIGETLDVGDGICLLQEEEVVANSV